MRKKTDSFLAFILTFIMVFNMLAQAASPPVYAEAPPTLPENILEEDSGLLSLEVPPETEEIITTEAAILEPAIIQPVIMESAPTLSEEPVVQLLSEEDAIVTSSEFIPPPPANFPLITAPGSITVNAEPPAMFSIAANSTHYFTFNVVTPGAFVITCSVEGPPLPNSRPVMTVKLGTASGASFNPLATDVSGTINYNIETAGAYYLEVANTGANGLIMLAVSGSGGGTPPASAPTDYTISSPGALIIGVPFNVEFFPEGSIGTPSNQYFTFTVTTPGAYTMGYMASGPAITLGLGTVSDETFTPITPDATTTAGIIHNFEATGTFFLKASNTSVGGSVGLMVRPSEAPPETPTSPIPVSGDMYDPVAIQVGQRYIVDPFEADGNQWFTFTLPEYGPYYVEYTTTGGVEPSLSFIAYTDTGSSANYYIIKSDMAGFLHHSFDADDLATYDTFALTIYNTGITGTITFAIKEMTTPPPVTVTDTIVPSETPGTTGGVSLTVTQEDSVVRIYSFEALAGKRYSAVVYKQSGEEYANLSCSFSDAFGAGRLEWSGPTFGVSAEGLPAAVYESDGNGTYYLNVQNSSWAAGSYIIKIYSNTPAAPVFSPAMINGATTPVAFTLAATEGADIYYRMPMVEDVSHLYSAPISVDISNNVVSYVVVNGIYSGLSSASYNFEGTKEPSFSPSASIQPEGTVISITGMQEGDTVYYTTDETHPYNSATRQVYTEPSTITVGPDGLYLRAIIKNSNGVYGYPGDKSITRGTPAPTVTNVPGIGANPGSVGDAFDAALASAAGASIYYTLDGTQATTSSTLYTAPISVDRNTLLRAIAVYDGITSTELSQYLFITQPRSITLNEVHHGMAYASSSEWFSFNIVSPGTYLFEVAPESSSHGFIYTYPNYVSPVSLYNDQGSFLANMYPINDPASMKYVFTQAGIYRLKVSTTLSVADSFSLRIIEGIKAPVPSIPVEINSSTAYITGGELMLTTTEPGGQIFYTMDGTTPGTTAGGSTMEFTGTAISLTTASESQTFTIKAITVTGSGSSTLMTFIYKVVPDGLAVNAIRYYQYWGSTAFIGGASYNADSYDLLVSQSSSYYYKEYVITSIKYELKMDSAAEWVQIGTVTGSALTYNEPVSELLEWNRSATPYSGNATLKATTSDVAGNTFAYSVPIVINMSAPTTPQNFALTPTQGAIRLTWTASEYSIPNSVYYIVYKGMASGEMSYLGYVLPGDPLIYTDHLSDAATVYYYKIKADTNYEGTGRSSAFTPTFSGQAIADDTPPIIESVSIPNGGVTNSNNQFSVTASDNAAVARIRAEVSSNDQEDWKTAADSIGADLTSLTFDLTGLPSLEDGLYDLRITVADQYNNTVVRAGSFTLDNTPPAVPTVAAISLPGAVRVSYDSVSSDVEYYGIQYKINSNETYNLFPDQPLTQNPTKAYLHQLWSGIGVAYDYKVTAWDFAGNSSPVSSVVTGAALAFQPAMTILPDISKPGQVLTLSATGFMPEETVYWYIDDSYFSWPNNYYSYADAEGNTTVSFSIPNSLSGAHRFKAVGYSSAARVIKTYVIGQYVPVVEVPAQANAGDMITVQVRDFGLINAGSTGYVQIYFNGTELSSLAVQNSTTGAAVLEGSRSYLIPYTASGTLEIRAVRDTYTAITTMNVVARSAALTVAPAGRSAGQTVTASVSGFAPEEGVEFSKNGAYVSYRYANQNGAVQLDIALGSADKGTVLFEAEGNTSDLRRSFLYESSPTLWSLTGPTSVYAGTSPNFTLSGLEQTEAVNFYVNGVFYAQVWGYAGGLAERTIYMDEPGRMQITAVGQTTGRTASMVCTSENPESLDPSLVTLAVSYAAGSVVTLNASGFIPYETVKFYWNNTQIASLAANVSGAASAQYTIPAETPAEAGYAFSAYGNSSELLASYAPAGAAHALGLALSGSPQPGQTLDAEITGSYTADPCKIYLDGRDITAQVSMSVNGDGNTVFTYPLPYTIPVGSHSLLVITNTGALGEVVLTVADPGTSIQVNATTHVISLAGFAPGEAIELRVNGGAALAGITADGVGAFVYTPAALYGAGHRRPNLYRHHDYSGLFGHGRCAGSYFRHRLHRRLYFKYECGRCYPDGHCEGQLQRNADEDL